MGEALYLWVKVGGAALGSAIAVVFKPGGDTRLKLVQRFVIGTICGFIFAPQVMEFFGWAYDPYHWLSASCLTGLTAYLFLQWLLGGDAVKALNSRLKSPIKK